MLRDVFFFFTDQKTNHILTEYVTSPLTLKLSGDLVIIHTLRGLVE